MSGKFKSPEIKKEAETTQRKPTPGFLDWRTAGLLATAGAIGGGFLIQEKAFDLDAIDAVFQGKPIISSRNPKDRERAAEKAQEIAEFKLQDTSFEAYEKARNNEALGLNCEHGQKHDPEKGSTWSRDKVPKFYTGEVRKGKFSPVYYCQMPTQRRMNANGSRVNFDAKYVSVPNGLEHQYEQVRDVEYLNVLCPKSEFSKGKDPKYWFHCRDYSALTQLNGRPGADVMISPFGPRKTPKGASDMHFGVDIPASRGTPVRAAYDGIVVSNTAPVDPESKVNTLGVIVLEHRLADGRIAYSEYMHLDSAQKGLKIGDTVRAGQVIGLAGGRGLKGRNTYGSHLHYGEWLAVTKIAPDGMPVFEKWTDKKNVDAKGKPIPIHAGGKLKNFAIPINPEMRCISEVSAPGARPSAGGAKGTPTPPAAPAPAPSPAQCEPGFKYTNELTRAGEGYILNTYIPGVYEPDEKAQIATPVKGLFNADGSVNWAFFASKSNAIKQSGVTIDTGFDIGQHSASDIRRMANAYVHVHGRLPDGLDVDNLINKLNPFFAKGYMRPLMKREAMEALVRVGGVKISDTEAEFLREASVNDFWARIERRYDQKQRNGVAFASLPMEVQTLAIDFAWTYGDGDGKGDVTTTRGAFWNYYYNGEWSALRDALKENALPGASKTRDYRERSERRAEFLGRALDRGWPERSNC